MVQDKTPLTPAEGKILMGGNRLPTAIPVRFGVAQIRLIQVPLRTVAAGVATRGEVEILVGATSVAVEILGGISPSFGCSVFY